MLFIDEYSQMTWVYFLKHKFEAFDMFRAFTKMIETQTGKRIKILRSDRGDEFINDNFTDFCDEHGIRKQFSAAQTPQQNEVVERKNRIV